MYIFMYIYVCIYMYIIYTYINFVVMYKCQNICIKNKTFIYLKVKLQFLPNLQRLNKVTKSVKSINLKTN